MPLSLIRFTLITLFPAAFRILEIEKPIRLFRICPRCNGLLELGQEYSTIIVGEFGCGSVNPYSGFSEINFRKSIQYDFATFKLRKPFITLQDSISFNSFFINSPISLAVSSGLFFE